MSVCRFLKIRFVPLLVSSTVSPTAFFFFVFKKPLFPERQGQETAAHTHVGTDKLAYYKSAMKWFLSMAELYYT